MDGCRAVALLPEGAGRLPVRVQGGSRAGRDHVVAALRAAVRGIEFVGDEQFARFTVELQPVAHRILGADGLEVIRSVPASAAGARSMARLIARSVMSSELLSLENPGSRMDIQVRVAGQQRSNGGDSHDGRVPRRARGVKLVGGGGARAFRIRRPGDPRSPQNSLVLEIQAAQDCFVTIVDVDSEGGVNVLFPNPIAEDQGYVPGGFVRAGEPVRIPDSLADDNTAQFWFDYSEPAGLDTIRVFAAADRRTAELIRSGLQDIAAAPRGDDGAAGGGGDPRQQLVAELKGRLSTVLSRGIEIVANKPRAQTQAQPHPQPQPQHAGSDAGGVAGQPQPDPQNEAASDWTAASVTIRIDAR